MSQVGIGDLINYRS